MECFQVGHGLLCRAKVGFRDNLQKRGASAIEVNTSLVSELVVDRLSGILFQMRPGDANRAETAVVHGHVKDALAEDNQTVRGMIIALEDDLRIKRALSVTTNIDFYRYKVSFDLEKAD